MRLLLTIQDRTIPVYADDNNKKKLKLLTNALEAKLTKGKKMIKRCLDSLISIEIVGCEAILHSYNEKDTVALSLY